MLKSAWLISHRHWNQWLCSFVLAAVVFASGMQGCKDSSTPPPEEVMPHPQGPNDLHPAERSFLEGRLDRTVKLRMENCRDSSDGLLLAFAIFLQGDEALSQRIFSEVMRTPRYRNEHLFRGLLAVLTGDMNKALEHLDQERKLPHRQFFASVLYVELLILAKRFDAAAGEVEELKLRYSGEPIIYHTEGHMEAARSSWRAALSAYQRSEELGGINPDLDDGIAAALIELGELDTARERVYQCRKDFPDYTEILFQELRLVHLDPDAPTEALATLAAEYKRRTKMKDRVEQVEQWLIAE